MSETEEISTTETEKTLTSLPPQKPFSGNSDEYFSLGTFILPIESPSQTYNNNTMLEDGKPSSRSLHFNHRVSQPSTMTPQNSPRSQAFDKANHECPSRRYLCMKGRHTNTELKSLAEGQEKQNEAPSKTFILYENFPPQTNKTRKSSKFEKTKNKYLYNDPFFDYSNYLKFETRSLSKLNSDSNDKSTFTLPRYERGKKILNTFSSKVSLLGSKTKKAHKSLTFGRNANSSDNFEKNILIGSEKLPSSPLKQVTSQDSLINPKEKSSRHKRQHSF